MAHTSVVRSLFDVLQQQQAEERDAAEVRSQARAFRDTARSEGSFSRILSLLSGQLFPLGQQYERARLEDTGLRPPSFAQQVSDGTAPVFGPQPPVFGTQPVEEQPFSRQDFAQRVFEQENLIRGQNPGMPDSVVTQLATQTAMGGLSPQAQQELSADLERTQADIEEFRRTEATLGNLGRNIFDAAGAVGRLNPLTGGGLLAADLIQQGPEAALQQRLADIPTVLSSVIPEQTFGPIEDIPAVGPSLADSIRFGTSPVGAATAVAAPPLFAAGEVGAVGAGTLAETLGAPTGVRIGAEVAGGILAPGAGLVKAPRLFRPGARAAARPGALTNVDVDELVARSADDLLPTQAVPVPSAQAVETGVPRLSDPMMQRVLAAREKTKVARRAFEDTVGQPELESESARLARENIATELGDDPLITLYRGIRQEQAPSAAPGVRTTTAANIRRELGIEGPGEFWSTDIERSRRYARADGQIYTVDVRASELADPEITRSVTSGSAGTDVEINFLTDRVPRRSRLIEPAPAQAVEPGVPTRAGTPVAAQAPPAVAERQAAETAQDAIQQGLSANPGRDARETWRRFAGANSEAALHRNAWGEDAYDLFDEAAIAVVRDSDNQSDEVIEIMGDMFAGGEERGAIGGFRQGERSGVQAFYDKFDNGTERLIAADPDFEMRALPEYFPHQFKVTKPERGFGPRGFKTSPGFLKKRQLKGALGDILDRRPDLDLATWDPVAYVKRHSAAVDSYINSLEAIRGLKAKGLIVPEQGAPAAWRTPDISPFKVRQKLQGWVAEPKVAQSLEQMFGVDAFDQNGALKLLKNVRETAFRAKVFGGAFQMVDYTFRDAGLGLSELARLRPGSAVRAWASPVKALARSTVPGLDRKLTRLAGNNEKLKLLYRNGLAAGVDPSISDEGIRAAGSIIPETIGGKTIPGARGLQQVIDYVGGGAYAKFHRETLEQSGLVILEKNLKKGVPLEEAGRLAVEETNVFFSSIPNWQSAVKSKTGRTLLKFPFFATGELEGWFRLPFQAPAGFAGIIGSTVIMAEMLNKVFTGKWLSKDQLNPYEVRGDTSSFKEKLPIVGKGGFNPTFLRPELPWKGPDGRILYLDLLGQSDTPFRFALDPLFATRTRLGQFPDLALDLAAVAHGEAPAFGEKVDSPASALRFAAQEVSPISVSGLTGPEVSRIGVAGGGLQSSGLNVLAENLGDLTTRAVQEDAAAGLFTGTYPSGPPTERGQLTREDKAAFDERHADLREVSEESSAAFKPDDTSRFFDQSETNNQIQDRALEGISSQARSGSFGNFSEQDIRRDLWDGVRRIETQRAGGSILLQESFPDVIVGFDREPFSREAELVNRYFDLQERHLGRRTDEQWAAYEADLQRTFSPADLDTVQRELGVGNHDLQNQWDFLNAQLEGYYDIPEGRSQSRKREALRRRNPQLDASLWVLGRVGRVLTGEAIQLAREAAQNIFGQSVQPTRGGGTQRSGAARPATPLRVR